MERRSGFARAQIAIIMLVALPAYSSLSISSIRPSHNGHGDLVEVLKQGERVTPNLADGNKGRR